MAVDSGFFLKLVCARSSMIIDSLLESRWVSKEYEGYTCIPIDADLPEWQRLPTLTREGLRAIFEAKMASGKAFGVRLSWKGGEEEGDFLVFPERELVFRPVAARRLLDDKQSTDVSWYVARLLASFQWAKDIQIESWVWRETTRSSS